jgi:mono/diheme cytochrome c family protein
VPRERPAPPPFEPEWLDRSLDRYMAWGLVFMLLLVGGFFAYRVREPSLRKDAAKQQLVSYRSAGKRTFHSSCAQCHGENGTGGSGPTLNAKEFLKSASDEQIRALVEGGISGTEMPAWSLDFGGTLTTQQINEIVTYVRSWQPSAPSVPNWRQGKP